jgi:hypothetical protein
MKGKMSPQREEVFNRAMNKQEDPGKLYLLADAFEAEELHEHAANLRGRADWFSLREQAFARAITREESPAALRNLAAWFEKNGLHEHAMHLNKRATSKERTQPPKS